MNEQQKKFKRAHERIWELDQAIAKEKITQANLPRRLQEARVAQREAKAKLGETMRDEAQTAGALVATKATTQRYSKASDTIVSKEVLDRTALTTTSQKLLNKKISRATDIRELISAHKKLRSLRAEVLRKLTAAAHASVQRKQAQITKEVEEHIAKAHWQEMRAQGALAKADSARAAMQTMEAKANALGQQAATRAAKLAVSTFAAQALESAVRAHQALYKQAATEVKELKGQIEHDRVKTSAVRVTILASEDPKIKGNQNLPKKKAILDQAKAKVELNMKAAKKSLQRKQRHLQRASKIFSAAKEKARWMKEEVVVQQLRFKAARHWLTMANQEMQQQRVMAKESAATAASASKAAVSSHCEAVKLKAKSERLATLAKIQVLTQATHEATASRRHVQATVQKQLKQVKTQSRLCQSALKQARSKSKEASSMFSMGAAMRTNEYRATKGKLRRKDAKMALTWETTSAAAMKEQGKAEVVALKHHLRLRTLVAKLKQMLGLLTSTAQQEYAAQTSLENAKLMNAAAQLQSKEKVLALKKKRRHLWMRRYRTAQREQAQTAAYAHRTNSQQMRTAIISEGEARIAGLRVRSAKRVQRQRQEAYQRLLSTVQKARMTLEEKRRKEHVAKLVNEATPGIGKYNQKLHAAKAARRAAAHTEEKFSHGIIQAGKRQLDAGSAVKRFEEQRIFSKETARAAKKNAEEAQSREKLAEMAWATATNRLKLLAATDEQQASQNHHVKAEIYKQLLSHKTALSHGKLQLANARQVAVDAAETVAADALKVERLAAKYSVQQYKVLRKREATLRRKAKTAEDRAKTLRSAGHKSKILLKAEKKAEEKTQLKEFAHARQKVIAQKTSSNKMAKIAGSLTKDAEKLAIARAMKKAAKKQTRKLKEEEDEALAAATRFTLAAKAVRSEFPHFKQKMQHSMILAANAKAALMAVSERLAATRKHFASATDEYQIMKTAESDGSKEWTRLQACAKSTQAVAQREHLRKAIKVSALAGRDYEAKARHYQQQAKVQKQLTKDANRKARIQQKEVRRLQKAQRKALSRGSSLAEQVTEKQDDAESWESQARNALNYAAKAMLTTREKGARIELGQAQTSYKTNQQSTYSIEKALAKAEDRVRVLRQNAVRHRAQAVTAQNEFSALRSKARRESAQREKLQVKLTQVSQPEPTISVQCAGSSGAAPAISQAWKKSTLKSLVSYYVHLHRTTNVQQSPPTAQKKGKRGKGERGKDKGGKGKRGKGKVP